MNIQNYLMDCIVLLTLITIILYGHTASQFISLSPSRIYNNHPSPILLFGSLGCDIESWYSAYDQRKMFMISYFEAIPGQMPLLQSDLLSFSSAMDYAYSIQTSFNISDTLHTDSNIQNDIHLMDVVLSSSSIMILSQVSDSSGAEHLFYRIISNYQYNTQNIHISAMKIWKIPYSSSSGPTDYAQVTAAKLYASNTFIIVLFVQNYTHLFNYLVDANSAEPISTTPNILQSPLDDGISIVVTAVRVRASKTHSMYLVVWSVRYYDQSVEGLDAIEAALYKNDNSMVKSISIMSATSYEGQYLYTLYDAISFNISTQTGFYAILYYDTSVPPDNRLCVRIVDDSASNAFDNDIIILSVKEQQGDEIQSARIRVLDLVPSPRYKLYLVVSWTYNKDINPGAVYAQMIEFSWTASIEHTRYHLYLMDDPYTVFSTDQTWDRVCMNSVDNQLLVASLSGDSAKTYIQLLTATVPTSLPTNSPSQSDDPTNSPVTDDPTHKSTDVPTNNPTNTATEGQTSDPSTQPSFSPITREKIIIEKENGKAYLLLLMVVPFIVFCVYRIKQYMKFVIVDKALILVIGIRRFNGDKLSDLPGIESNVNDLRRLWFDTYHYTVKICNESTLECTKRDIIRFIDTYKSLLEDTDYKAVIVHILSHGSGDDSFVTTDLKTMQTSFFEHELITAAEFAGHPELIKFIFHHACRGHADYFKAHQIEKCSNKFSVELKEIVTYKKRDARDSKTVPLRTDYSDVLGNRKQRTEPDAHSNCVVLYGTIEDRALSDDGHFTESICKIFGSNSTNLIKRDLYSLIRQIGSHLETTTNNAQICTSKGIGTLRNKIRFQKCTDKIRFQETH
eukprot:232316_1